MACCRLIVAAQKASALNGNVLFSVPPPPFQAILLEIPRLQHIILVDRKPTSWPDMPRGIMVHNMDTVQELGSRPEKRERGREGGRERGREGKREGKRERSF